MVRESEILLTSWTMVPSNENIYKVTKHGLLGHDQKAVWVLSLSPGLSSSHRPPLQPDAARRDRD